MVPVVPVAKAPARLMAGTFGFHSGQCAASAQIFQMVPGSAATSRERPAAMTPVLLILVGT